MGGATGAGSTVVGLWLLPWAGGAASRRDMDGRIFQVLVFLCAFGGLFFSGCDSCKGKAGKDVPQVVVPQGAAAGGPGSPSEGAPVAGVGDAIPTSLPSGLLVSYSQFLVEDGKVTAKPGPALLEIVTRRDGKWHVETLEDAGSNVFHKALYYPSSGEAPGGILTLGGMAASLKLWSRSNDTWVAQTLWEKEFGGKFNRMRDAELGALYAPGEQAIAVATHDQGVVATVRPADGKGRATPLVTELYKKADTFIHEIELGDLDKDGYLEVYATPSEPNSLDGGEQSGQVIRFAPGKPNFAVAGNPMVADLGNRHAKEILVDDVDGDGTDELYVAVEALTEGTGADMRIREPVEIRRYDVDTAPDKGVVIATIEDRLCRFLTAGDIDGDGKKEIVAAAFRSGLWLLSPGKDPKSEWSVESIDRESSGFEHAALLTDLDGDGTDELYVSADDQGELRRYVWVNHRPVRSTILTRENPRARMAWNIMPIPADF